MLRVFTQGSHPKFPTMVLSLSPQGCSPVGQVLAEGQVLSLMEVSDSRDRMLGETLQAQGRSRWHLSRCAQQQSVAVDLCLSTVLWTPWALRQCLVI